MKKITEASPLSALGVEGKKVKQIHKQYKLSHDAEFETLKTKGQMQALLKDGRLIIGISPAGNIASLGKESGWGSSKSVSLIVDGESHYVYSMKDALALVPGRGWKWFASTDRAGSSRGDDWRKKRDEQEITDETSLRKLSKQLDNIYATKIRSDAEKYAQDVRNRVIELLDAQSGEKYPDYDNRDEFSSSHEAFKLLKYIAQSEKPFYEIARKSNEYMTGASVHRLSQFIAKLVSKSGWNNEDNVAKFVRNEKLAIQKIVRFMSNELKKIRDNGISAAKDERLANKKLKLPKVKKAWESYKQTGEVNILSETDDNCKLCKGEGFDPRPRTYGDICPKCSMDEIPDRVKKAAAADDYKPCEYCKNWEDGFDPRPKTYGDMCPKCDGAPPPTMWMR